jgi:hypothetical protein
MAEWFVELRICDGRGKSGPHFSEEDAKNAMLVSVNWRQKNLGETWRKTNPLKWGSTNGHTLEVTKDE